MSGIITKLGWSSNDEGKDVFRAVVEYPSGPDDRDNLTLRTVFNRLPVVIVLAKSEKAEAAE